MRNENMLILFAGVAVGLFAAKSLGLRGVIPVAAATVVGIGLSERVMRREAKTANGDNPKPVEISAVE